MADEPIFEDQANLAMQRYLSTQTPSRPLSMEEHTEEAKAQKRYADTQKIKRKLEKVA